MKLPTQLQVNNLLDHYKNYRYSDAEKLAISMTQEFPEFPISWKVLGAVLMRTCRMTQALVVNQTAAGLVPNDFEAHYDLGIVLQELGRFEESKGSLLRATELNPDFIEGYYYLGIVYRALDRFDESEENYRKVLKLKPDLLEAIINIGQLYVDREKYELALEQFDLLDTCVLDTANAADARARGMECLYALGRIDEIYERIESQDDDKNIRVSALASFLNKREKKDTTHNFCKNPLDFLHYSKISSHIENTDSFVTELVDELGNVDTNFEPFNTTTRNGYQSSVNLFNGPYTKMRQLQTIIMDEISNYHSKFKDENCSFIKNWPSDYNLYGWHVILKKQGYQLPHIHTSGWLSGVIYLKVVPSLENNEGAIEFGLNGATYNDDNSPKVIHQPEAGDIVFFPSSLHHSTIPFTTDTDRIVVSFDLAPNFEPMLHDGIVDNRKTEGLMSVLKARNTRKKSKPVIDNPLILNREVEPELIAKLYEMDFRELDKTIDARYGNGRCSPDFELFENDIPIIKSISEDLIRIMKEAVKSDIFIMSSFFNIMGAGGGSTPHDHLSKIDEDRSGSFNLVDHKHSLVYYLDVGDQDCDEPGTLKLYNPVEDILPSNGMITIIPAGRKHSAVYGGKKDRVIIGVNFYSL
jgi:tetratricopeptide (TPR) repeat protein